MKIFHLLSYGILNQISGNDKGLLIEIDFFIFHELRCDKVDCNKL